MIGGCSIVSGSSVEVANRDIYASRDDGFTWLRITDSAPFIGRCEFAATATVNGIMIVAGGRVPNTDQDVYGPIVPYSAAIAMNDVWTSLDGGYTWLQLTSISSFSRRFAFGMTID